MKHGQQRALRAVLAGCLLALDRAAPRLAPAGLLTAAVTTATLHAYRREYLLVGRPGGAV